jgi:hypothetical protein
MTLFSLFRTPESCQSFPVNLSFHSGYHTATLVGWWFGGLVPVSTRKTDFSQARSEEFWSSKKNAASLENSRRSILDPSRGPGQTKRNQTGRRLRAYLSKAEYSTHGRKKTISAVGWSVVELIEHGARDNVPVGSLKRSLGAAIQACFRRTRKRAGAKSPEEEYGC